MSRATSTIFAIVLLLTSAVPVLGAKDEAGDVAVDAGAVIPGEVIVRLRTDRALEPISQRGMSVLRALAGATGDQTLLVSTGGRSVTQAITELRRDPAVALVEPNYRVELADSGSVTAMAVNDPETSGQYSLDRMRVRDAWGRLAGDEPAGVIAVLDTGVQFNHPDLAGRLVPGWDFVNNDADASDDNGHGTWVTGIMVANANDGYGIAGISWTDKVMPIKIMDRTGSGSTASLMNGIKWAADHGASVINMSVGGFPYSQAVQDAVNYAWSKGVVLVGAAGNNRREETYYPASFDNVVSVSATQPEDEFSNWSSWGPKVDVSAPGSSVLTTNCFACTYESHNTWGEHTYISGTSFATPNTAGVVALIRAKYPSYTPAQVVARLQSTTDDLGYTGWDNRYGIGRINALRALGGSVAAPSIPKADGLEPNNGLSAARTIALGAVTRPSIYPAGDVDWFAVDVPRAGRLDVRVTGVVDNRAYPWNKSPIPVDPIVELYTSSGALLTHVDAQWEGGTELAQTSVAGPTRIFVKVWNWYANGNATPYSVTPTYVDTVAPKAQITKPASGASGVSRITKPEVVFNEAITNVTSATLRIRDTVTNAIVPATVSYNSATRTATITPQRMEGLRAHRVEATNGITDVAGNPLATTTLAFTTGPGSFLDADGNTHEAAIEWILSEGITGGCAPERYCPSGLVTRGQMASFLARALGLPLASGDHFTDDTGNKHEANINRIAEAGITTGCTPTTFCPDGIVTRAQMATFLARALHLAPVSKDFFSDDAGNTHEKNINAIAAAGLTVGCTATTYCPNGAVTRAQMATFLYRAFRD